MSDLCKSKYNTNITFIQLLSLQDLFTFNNIKLLSNNFIDKNPIFNFFTKEFTDNYKYSLRIEY